MLVSDNEPLICIWLMYKKPRIIDALRTHPETHIVQLELPPRRQATGTVRTVIFWPSASTTSHLEPDFVLSLVRICTFLLIFFIRKRKRERERERELEKVH